MSTEFTATPDYGYFTLRDPANYGAVGAGEALEAARRDVSASTGYEIYVVCAQGLVGVRMAVDQAPPQDGGEREVVRGLSLECPSGELRLGDATLNAIAVPVPQGPGRYDVDVYYRGRAAALEAVAEINRNNYWAVEQLEPFAGLEQYHLAINRSGPA